MNSGSANAGGTNWQPRMLHGFFDRSAERHGGHVAVEIPPAMGAGEETRCRLTYSSVSARSIQFGHALRSRIRPGDCVAVLLSRRAPDLYPAQIGVLRAGGAYLCLDPAFPDDHLLRVLRDAEPMVILTDAGGAQRLERGPFGIGSTEGGSCRVLRADAVPDPASGVAAGGDVGEDPDRLAYLIYTSGTTGEPKGVMIQHRAICNLVGGDLDEFRLGPGDRVVQGSSTAYDSSVEEGWMALSAGATVLVMDDEASRLGPDLAFWLRRERATVFCPPPTLLRASGVIDPAAELPDLRLLYVGGESLPSDIAGIWSRSCRLVNGYGPTECCVTCVRGDVQAGEMVHIGRPVAGFIALVLDGALEEVPPGVEGELCLSGVGLAAGYRGREDLTRERFPVHPRFGRIYRTGDLVRRREDGNLVCLGRLDSQVKVRGHRIELEAVEAAIAAMPGVLEVACAVEDLDCHGVLVAFLVSASGSSPPDLEWIKRELGRRLPPAMVPSRLGWLPGLPRTAGGKLDRRRLPRMSSSTPAAPREEGVHAASEPGDGSVESDLLAEFKAVLKLAVSPGIEADFFTQLGGDSVTAAMLISRTRSNPRLARLTVRDVYEAPTVARLAGRCVLEPGIAGRTGEVGELNQPGGAGARGTPVIPGWVLQFAWSWIQCVGTGAILCGLVFSLLPELLRRGGFGSLVLILPLLGGLGVLLQGVVALVLTAVLKRWFVGVYCEGVHPAYSRGYLSNWVVQQVARFVPWRWMEGTELQCIALRCLGARIGQRVYLGPGVNLQQGGWDLLEIGNDVMIEQDVSLRLVELESGCVRFGRICIGDGASLGVHSGMDGGASVGVRARLEPMASLIRGSRVPDGEVWDGIPAARVNREPMTSPGSSACDPGGRDLSGGVHAGLTVLARALYGWGTAVPALLLDVAWLQWVGVGPEEVLSWMEMPGFRLHLILGGMLLGAISLALTLGTRAAALRLLGRVRPGRIRVRSLEGIRVSLKVMGVQAGGDWLYGTLFWPTWLRWAGMNVGRGCEISSLIGTVPELVQIGEATFCADGIYMGSPTVWHGAFELGMVRIGARCFIGNGALIAAGESMPEGVLLGVRTRFRSEVMGGGGNWFGHPAFELRRREVVEAGVEVTTRPGLIRYASRVTWEVLRFFLPAVPATIQAAWYAGLALVAPHFGFGMWLILVVPASLITLNLAQIVAVVTLKWGLLGRVRSSQHPLWSCWASRWDFVCMAWSLWMAEPVALLEGTPALAWLVRAMGVRVGRDVLLGQGFAQDLADPDMLVFEDGATVDCLFQAHTFEDRVLKMEPVRVRAGATVGRNAVVLYGSDLGAGCRVSAQSVVMKRERLVPHTRYEGFPVQRRRLEDEQTLALAKPEARRV